jgi:hypothetical protein
MPPACASVPDSHFDSHGRGIRSRAIEPMDECNARGTDRKAPQRTG